MAQNLASKYSKRVDERFKKEALTGAAINQDYEWSGVNTVTVYSVDVVDMVDYNRGVSSNRYGTPDELGTGVQDLVLTQDRSFTFTIDRGNYQESMMVTESGKALRRQISEIVVPEVDVYRLATLDAAAVANGKDDVVTAGATDASNAYANFLSLQESLSDDLVPAKGRIAFLTAQYYNFLKQSNFVIDSGQAYADRKSGSYGTVDGVRLIVVPSSYFPANTDLILTHPVACTSPTTLKEYKTHNNPPGINGWLVEGRIIYDAFVLNNKVDAIAVHKTSA